MSRTKEQTSELRSALESATPPRARGSRSADEIARLITELITTRDLDRGARLPSERDLAELLGASRPTVSQAIRILVVKGMIDSRRGSGAYVLRRPQAALATSVDLMLGLDQNSLEQLGELRLWLESTGAAKAIELAGDTDIRILTEFLDAFRGVIGDVAQFIAIDTQFHAAIVGAAKNAYLTAIYESVHTTLINDEYRDWISSKTVPGWLVGEEAHRALIEIHEAILDALIARSPEAMALAVLRHHEAMSTHLGHSS